MPRSAQQKQKILYLARILMEETDEQHPLSIRELIARLAAQGIAAERKSLYADLEELRRFGLDIVDIPGPKCAYFVGERRFQLPELRLLVDAVQSSRFLTQKKSAQLIKKLQTLASRHEAEVLGQNVVVSDRVRSMNESVYFAVDAVDLAITKKKKLRFRYFEWDANGKKNFRRAGAFYVVSPYYLVWDDENYYLVALEEKGEKRHFRVDKMADVALLEEARDGEKEFAAQSIGQYQKKTFGMFGGTEERVTLWCAESIAGPIFDRFGQDLVTRRAKGGFEVTVPVIVSPLFFSYLVGFGAKIRILAPTAVKEAFVAHQEAILAAYRESEEAEERP